MSRDHCANPPRLAQSSSNLTFASLNIRNFHFQRKLGHLRQLLRQLRPDVLLLTEAGMKLNDASAQQVLCRCLGAEALVHVKAKGPNKGLTLLLFTPALHLELQAEALDGSWFAASYTWQDGQEDTRQCGLPDGGWLVGMHAPVCNASAKPVLWWEQLHAVLQQLIPAEAPLIMLGDMNVHMSGLDKSSPFNATDAAVAEAVRAVVSTFAAQDVTRLLYPQDVVYTYHKYDGSASRLDYIFASRQYADHAARAGVCSFPASDHNAVWCSFLTGAPAEGPADPACRPLPAWIFHNTTLAPQILQYVDQYVQSTPVAVSCCP